MRQAVVTVEKDADGENTLVGHVVSSLPADLDAAEVRKRLGRKLPTYMAPGRLVYLEELPVTPHGKVDRRVLAAQASGWGRVPINASRPQTPTEERLAAIWRSVLRVDEVSTEDNFFDLGGHSLLLMRMLVEIEKKLGRRFTIGAVMGAPTIRELARLIDKPTPGRSLVSLQPLGPDPTFIWLPGANGDVFVFRELARTLGPDVPVIAFEPLGADGESTPLDSVEEIAARYVEELVQARPDGPYCLGGYCFGGFVAYEMAKQLDARGRRVRLLVLLDCDGHWRTLSGWRDSLGYHLGNLGRQSVSEWPEYFAEHLRYRWEETMEAIRRRAGRGDAPAAVQRVVQASRRAARGYMPTACPRKLLHLRSRQRSYADPFPFRGKLVSEIDLHELEGAEATMFSAPGVARLAELLRVLRRESLAEDAAQPPLIAATK